MRRFQLVKISDACPEQYDVYFEGKEIAYFRLRWGEFTAQLTFDGVLGDAFYYDFPNGHGTFDDSERVPYLNRACIALDRHLAYQQEINQMEPIYDLVQSAG